MGHSASIANKYKTPERNEDEASDNDSLATVSSFRPTSPYAHTDAREFKLEQQSGGGTTRSRNKTSMSSHQGSYSPQMNGTIPKRTLASQRNITASSSTLGSQPRSMREVRHFLVKNPELLTGKQRKDIQRRSYNGDVYPQKQIKTKQDLYLGLFDPPIIYGKGAEPEKQLKMNQRMYLQLIYPTVSGMKYYYPAASPNRNTPAGDEMVVVRRGDLSRQEDYMKKPMRARSRPPLKAIEQPRTPSKQQMFMEPSPTRSPSKSPRIPNGYSHTLPSSTPVRELQVAKRKGNSYIDVNLSNPPNRTGKQSQREQPRPAMEVERRFETPVNKGREHYKPKKAEEDIVFNFDVEELGLTKKKSETSFPRNGRDDALEPLYFRKSLAYNPKYSNGGNVLSDPL